MIQSDGVNSRWKKYADTEPAETVEVTEEPSLEVPVVESPSQSQEKPPVSNRWSKYATGPTTPAETIPSRPATPAMAAQAATTARQQAAEPPKQEAFEDVPKEIASFKFNPEVENMIIGDDIAANTGLYAMNRGNVKGYYKTNDVVKGVVADLETKANQLKIDYEAKVAQLNETTKAEQEKLNAEFSQKDAEIEKGYAEAVKAAKTPEEKALADKNYELDKNALNAEFKAKADPVDQKLKGEYDKAYADLTKSMEDLSSYTKDWETPEGFGKWYEGYEKENRAIGDSERKSIQEVIKAMPNDYEGKKAALQRFTNSYLDTYDGQPEYDQVKDELYDIIRSETLFDAQGNPTPYALKNQAEIEKRSMADEYNRLNAEFKEITKGVLPTGYGSDMYYLALNKIPGAREMQTRLSYLSQAINNFERISKLPESEMKGKRAGSFMEGMGGVKNLIPNTLSAGLLEQMESVGMLRLAQKVKHGQALTEDEQLYLDSVSLLETTVQLMRPDFKNWYLAGRATGESLPWIINMIATGGAYSWGKLGMMKVLKSAGYREGRKWSAKTIGKTILTEAAGSATRIPFQPSFYQNIAENIAKPESVAGEMGLEGKMKATGKTMAGAVVKASYMQFAENFSEISGTYMDAGGRAIVGLVAKKLGLNVANAIPKTKLVSAMGQFGKVWSKFRDVAKISSIPAEYGEEIFANVLHLVDGTTKPSDIVDLRENWITFLSVASMVGPMQVVSGTAKGTAAVITKQDLAKGMQEFFSGQQIKEIDRIISIQDVGKKTDALLDFIQRNRVDGAEPLQSLARYVWDEQVAQGTAAASETQDAPATTDAKAPLYMVDKKTGSVEEISDLISTAESTADLAGITIENDPEAELELSTKFNKLQEDERFNEAIKGVTDAAEIERLTDEHVAKLEEIDDKYKADFEKIQEQKEQPVNPEVKPKVETVKPESEEKLAETEDKKAEPQPIEGNTTAESEQKKETVKQKSPDTQAMMEEVGVTNPDVQKNIGEGAFSGRVKFVDVVLAKGKKAGEVIIESIRTPKLFRRMGRAGKAMAKLTESADKHGVTLRLKAKPEQGSGISQEQLVEFYKKHGFMFKEGGIEGVRTPWDKKVTVAEPAKKEFERLSANATGAYPSEWVQSQEQLPVSVKNAFKATGQKGTIDGVFDPVTKKVWFVADIVKTADDVSRVWTHEQIGHRGVRLVFPKKKDRDAFYEDVFKRVSPERIREVVSKSEWDVWESSKKDAPDRIRLADEYVAYLSEKVVNKKTMTVEEKSIWKQIVAMVRKAMAKMLGKKNVNELTDDDIAKIINQSLRAVYPEKKGGAGYAEETGKGAQEKGAEVGAVEGEAGRLRVRDDERDGLEAEEGEKIDQKQKLIEKGINFVNYEKGRSEKYEGVPRKSTPTAQEMGGSVIAAGGFRERSIGEVRRVGERDVNIVRSFIPEEETVSAIKEEFKDAFVDDEILEITGESEAFHYFISKAKLSNKYGASVYVYAKDEYADMRLFSTPDGNAGFAIKSDGDFVSVFSSNVAGKKYRIPAIMILGIKLGGIKLDCFNTILPDYYAMFGFKAVSRVKFDPQYAPEPYKDEHDFSHDGWDYQRFKPLQDGKPDVVYFVYDGGDFKNIEKRIGKFSPYTENSEKTIKYYPMDKAMEIQARAVSEIIQKYNLIRVTTDTGLGTRFSVSYFPEKTAESIQNNPIFISNLYRTLDGLKFGTGYDFRKWLQDVFKTNLNKLRKVYGNDLAPGVMNEAMFSYMSDVLTAEVRLAIAENPDAMGWYDEQTKACLSIMAEIYPEFLTDIDAQTVMTLAMAMTSNGNKVDYNMELADRQYAYFSENGRFDDNMKMGKQQSAIRATMTMLNHLLDNGVSIRDIREFFTTKYRIGDLSYIEIVDGKKKKSNIINKGLVNDVVYGASVIGRKIGNGFFMNLWGDFSQLTIDRWVMRTFGRIAGYSVVENAEMRRSSLANAVNALTAVRKNPEALKALRDMIGNIGNLSDRKIILSTVKAFSDPLNREISGGIPVLDNLRLKGNNYYDWLFREILTPTGSQISFVERVFDRVINNLKSDGINITMADAQAVEWMQEKVLSDFSRTMRPLEQIKKNYEKESLPNYENAAKRVAAKHGIDGGRIESARTSSDRIRKLQQTATGILFEGVSKAYKDKVKTLIQQAGWKGVKDVEEDNTRFSVSDELAPPSTEIKGGRVYKNSRGEEIRFRSVMPKDNALQQKYRYKPKKDNEIFTGMERQIGKIGFMNLTGPATINSPEDVAFLFRNLESAAVENAFVVMMDKDGKYVVLYVGTGNTVGVVADPVLMATAAKEFGAERIVFVHNHPSGNLSASDADMNMHEKLVSACEGICDVLDSVIIDLDKGMFGTFRSTYRDAMYKGDEKREELPVKMFQFNKQILYSKSAEWVTISGSPDVATYLSRVKRGVGNKTMVIIMNRRNAITRTYLSTKLPSKAELIYMAGKHGESIILSSPVSPSTSDLKKLKVDLQKVNISLLDFIEVGQDPSIVNSYKSYSDYGLMEPSPKYVEEIPRFSVGETIEVDGVMRPTTNSEGRPIHPTEEGVRNFWKWFLDSVTVNKKGHPIVFYHNTDAQFTEFDTGKIGTKTDKGFYGSGFYFTSGVGDTHYGEIEMGVYLKIESPYYKKESHRNYEIDSEKLKSDGHDGAIVYPSYHDFNPDNPMEKIAEAVVYEPEQIKSATDNTGTFSEWTADIRFRATPSVPPAPNQFIDDILNTLVSKGALSPKRRDAILQKFRFIPNIKTLPQDEQDFTFIKMLLDEGRINLSKGLGELSSIITKSLNNIRRDEKEMVTDGQYRSIINRLGNADTVKKMQALLDYVFETVILGRGAKYKAALKMAQKWQGKIADKNKGEKSQFGTARAMANNVEAIDLKQLSFEELEEFSDIASRMFLSPRNPSIPHLAMLDNMFWTRLRPEREKKEPTAESIGEIITAIQDLDTGTIVDIPTYVAFRRALNRYAKQAAEALASATPDVVEELESNMNDTLENIEKAIEESIKTMTEELEDFRKAYGVHLVRRLKQADTRKGAQLLETHQEIAAAEELIGMQAKDIMDMDINMLAEFETTINNLREGYLTPAAFEVIMHGIINHIRRLTLDSGFKTVAEDKTGIWKKRQKGEGRRGVQTLVPKTLRKRDFFNELVRQFKSKQPFRIDAFLGNFSETKKIGKTYADVGRAITMAEIDKQHYDKSAGKAYETFSKGKSAKKQEKWRKWIFYYMATLRWQSSRFSEKTPNIFHAIYGKLYEIERSKVDDPTGFDDDAKTWVEFMDFMRQNGALNPADENGAETVKEMEAEAIMRRDNGVAAIIDWVRTTIEQYKGMNKVSAMFNGRSLIWGENYIAFMRKYKNDNIESETNIASWLNRAMFNANFVAGSTYDWRGNPMYMEDDIMRVMSLYTEMMRRNYYIYPSLRSNVTALKESSRDIHAELVRSSPSSHGNNIALLGRALAEGLRSRISSYYNSNYMIEQSVALKRAEVAIKKTMLVKIEKFMSEFSVNISRIILATMNIPVANINRLWKNYDFWGGEINSWINKGMWSAYSTEINYSLFGGKIEAGRIRRAARGAEQFADWMIKAPDMGAGRILFVHSTLEKFRELTGEDFDEKKWQESWSYRQKWADAKEESMYFADTRVEELFNSKNPLSEGEIKALIGGLIKRDRRNGIIRSFSMLMSFGQNDTNQVADSFRRIRYGGPKARLRAIRDINALFMSNFMYAVIRAWAGVMSYKYMYKPAFDAIGNAFVSAFGAPGGGDDDEVMTAIEAKDKEYMDKKTNAFKSGDYYLDILKYKVGPDFLLGGSSNIVEYGGKWLVWIYDRTIGLTDEQREAISAAFYQRYIMLIPHSWGDPEKILIRAIPPLWETAFEDALSFAHSIGDTIMGQTAQSIIEAVFDAEESGQLTKKQVYDLLNLWFTASKYLMFFHPAIPIAERQIRKELRYLNRVAKEEKKEGKTNKAGTEGTQEFKPAGYPKK